MRMIAMDNRSIMRGSADAHVDTAAATRRSLGHLALRWS